MPSLKYVCQCGIAPENALPRSVFADVDRIRPAFRPGRFVDEPDEVESGPIQPESLEHSDGPRVSRENALPRPVKLKPNWPR